MSDTAFLRKKDETFQTKPTDESVGKNVLLMPQSWRWFIDGLTKNQEKRARVFHQLLNGPEFRDFLQPVSVDQVAAALEHLDVHHDGWESDEFVSAWEYVLPALHRLYPDRTKYGYTASFGPSKIPGHRGAVLWASVGFALFVCVITGVCFRLMH